MYVRLLTRTTRATQETEIYRLIVTLLQCFTEQIVYYNHPSNKLNNRIKTQDSMSYIFKNSLLVRKKAHKSTYILGKNNKSIENNFAYKIYNS